MGCIVLPLEVASLNEPENSAGLNNENTYCNTVLGRTTSYNSLECCTMIGGLRSTLGIIAKLKVGLNNFLFWEPCFS